MDLTRDDLREVYRNIYNNPGHGYVVSDLRFQDAMLDIGDIPCRGSFLDVGCGTGKIMSSAKQLGFRPACGVDVVSLAPSIIVADPWDLPFEDKSFDVSIMLDVIEHLLPGDDRLACLELLRVTRSYILISANNSPSVFGDFDLHVNKRAYEEWDDLLKNWFSGCRVFRRPGPHMSPAWGINLG